MAAIRGMCFSLELSTPGLTRPAVIVLPAAVFLLQIAVAELLDGNQLTAASENSGSWSQSYGYDVNGNRWVPSQSSNLPSTIETPTAATAYSLSAVPNQINACTTPAPGCWTYDSAGNLLSIYVGTGGNRNFTYDAESRQVSANINGNSSTYAYDGNGLRVTRTPAGAVTTVYVYDAWGNMVSAYGPTEASPCGTATCYLSSDHLGSTRMLTDTSGNAQRRYDFLPFGQEILAGIDGRTTALGYLANPDDTNPKFTGQNRDVETGNDWFNIRHMSGAQGRFQSVDPANAGASATDPQTWNAYAYVGNNPLSYTDPSGMVEEGGGGGIFGFLGGLFGDIGNILESFFGGGGGGGSKPPPTPIASVPVPFSGPTWSVTGWGTSDSSVLNIPGLMFFAQATGQLPRTFSTNGGLLHCQPNVISAMRTIWTETSNGTSGAEASFNVNGSPSSYSIHLNPFTNQKAFQTIPLQADTFANFHVHPNSTGPDNWKPSTPQGNSQNNGQGDIGMADRNGIQIYVVSRTGLGFYDPATRRPPVLLRQGMSWAGPCK
jgi:RHS repeat-associated protein